MILELINTGTELMLGRVLNTHHPWLCRQLTDRGYRVTRQVSVSDTGPDIQQAVLEALSRADGVITTGGLGPTSDDITRERIAEMLGCPLQEDPEVRRRIEQFFADRRRRMPGRILRQALVPAGALVLANHQGTAPGLVMKVAPNPFRPDGVPSWLAMLPGPPRELRPMFLGQLLPWIERESPPPRISACRTLRTTGIGESAVEELIEPRLKPLVERGLEIGYCSRPGEVDLRLVAVGTEAEEIVRQASVIASECVGANIFGEGDEDLEGVIVRRLRELRATLSVAESCTGGLLGHRLTNVPGASEVFRVGWITYSNEAKQECLGVRAETLAAEGAVSEATAREMAEGARRVAASDYALGITGIAGPAGGSVDKPVGTVWIALAASRGTVAVHACNAWDRLTFKQVTTQQALELLRGELEK